MEPTIPGTMTASLMWKTVNTLTLNVYSKTCTGIVTGGLASTNSEKTLNSRISALKKLNGCIKHYSDHVDAQNARNEKTQHTERNRTVEDLLKSNKTCPEESIYQIGTIEESVPPETLALIVSEFYEEFEKRFGSHIHILDWALHLDEGTPHIHERHVFDCENRYGEICPQREKALEKLGFELPDPTKPKGKNNNRKQVFDVVCRTLLFDISRKHGIHLEQEPSYGGRAYLEKQDYILMKQKEKTRPARTEAGGADIQNRGCGNFGG